MINGRPPKIKYPAIQDYWSSPPPHRSARCEYWVKQLESGWKPNRRLKTIGYYSSAEWYGVYIWEYVNVIAPMERKLEK